MLSIIFKKSVIAVLVAIGPLANTSQASLPIIPNGAGFGMTTTAGSGRNLRVPNTSIFKVTNLKPSGAGSLQECIYATGPRTCVFEVSGTIDLTGDRSYDGSVVINLKNPFITIAGQTAPSPGITVKGKTLRIEAHDVLIQHLRFRVGDSPDVLIAPDVRDTILIAGAHNNPNRTPYNIVIDQCSMSWAIDDIVSMIDTSHDITLSNNIISEGLDRSLHSKGRHSKGLMAVGNNLSIYRNLIASVNDRAPLDISPNSIYINNLSSNAKHASFSKLSRSKFHSSQGATRNNAMIGNVRLISSTTPGRGDALWGMVNPDLPDNSKMFQYNNVCDVGHTRVARCEIRNLARTKVAQMPIDIKGIEIWPAKTVQKKILARVGARPLDRDAVDQRIIDEVTSGSGTIPDCVSNEAVYYPAGSIENVGLREVTIGLDQCYPNRFKDQSIELGRAESPQVRKVLEHICVSATKNKLVLDRKLDLSALENTPRYRILNLCTKHAGGFPKLAKNKRALSIPEDFNRLLDSGYTRLEEYLHSFYPDIE